jgi:PKD repeat protein
MSFPLSPYFERGSLIAKRVLFFNKIKSIRRSFTLNTLLQLMMLVGLFGFGLIRPSFASSLSDSNGSCPPVTSTSKFTITYGEVLFNGNAAPVGTIVHAESPRGDVVGCFEVSSSGNYGTMYLYGEDSSVTPILPGMRAGEQVAFYADNIQSVASPTLIWQNDKDLHEIELNTTGEPAPQAAFSGSPTSGYVPLSVQFTDSSSGVITNWDWDFGDGESSTQQNPSHTYTQAGTYTVSLEVIGSGGSDQLTRSEYIIVVAGSPQANFSANYLSGIAPFTVNFTNLSSNYSASLWSFGDGNSSSLKHPQHVYTQKGTYSVSLAVIGPGGADTELKPAYIQVYAAVNADFIADRRAGVAPLEVHFINQSSGDWSELSWDFGDGGSSNSENPLHLYQEAGTYSVSLNASGLGGADLVQKTDHITVYQTVAANFSALPRSGNAPLTVNFENLSAGDYDQFLWDFGDGESSIVENPAHIYHKIGHYDVSLTVSGLGGTDTVTMEAYISVLPELDFPNYLPLVIR